MTALRVNGQDYVVAAPVERSLADVLRHDLGYTGTHLGCEHGICGACTVLVDGEPTRSCLVFGVQADDCEVETVEGLAGEDGALNPLQEAFSEHHALQCGFCTPGQIVSAVALVETTPEPTTDEIRHRMAGNICRCGAYPNIEEAIRTWRD